MKLVLDVPQVRVDKVSQMRAAQDLAYAWPKCLGPFQRLYQRECLASKLIVDIQTFVDGGEFLADVLEAMRYVRNEV